MSTRYTVCFARRGDHTPDLKFLKKEDLAHLLETPPDQFVQAFYDFNALDFGKLRGLVEDLASRIGEAIGFAVQANVEHFAYVHAKPGRLLRALAYNGDTGWYEVLGEPEPWERELLFRDQRLAEVVADYADAPEIVATIRAAWAAGRLQSGSPWPSIWADEIAHDVRVHQKLEMTGEPQG